MSVKLEFLAFSSASQHLFLYVSEDLLQAQLLIYIEAFCDAQVPLCLVSC